jgi:murein DD-endopeptidase MepM/ murein hydrolase activator NlpD
VRLFPRTARRRLFGALLAGALAVGAVSVPLAHADDLKDRRERIEDRIKHADQDLDHSSARMRRAMAALDTARRALLSARAELDRAKTALAAARERDLEMELALERARARLAQAQAELATGRSDLAEQKEAVTELVTTMYQAEDPHLQALTSMMSAEDPADLTWAEEGRDVVVRQETRAYDELRASEVLLEVREQQVADAEREVEHQREAAAAHLVETRQLTRQARHARAQVRTTVDARRHARDAAATARRRDLRELQQLKAQERKVKQLILARARRAARSSGGYRGSTGSFLGWPVAGGYVTSPFGYRTHPIYGYYSLHNGTDFGKGCGAPLLAAASGRVISRYYSSVYGNRLYVSVGTVNGKNLTIVYNHASSYTVGVGQTVSRGQTLGYMGTTGWSTACHLHFTVLVNGRPVQPMNWM